MPQAGTMPMESQGAARLLVIGTISFLTLVDLFAVQAILPSLAKAYDVKPGVIGSAVNVVTFGMAAAGIVVAWFNRFIPRRLGVSLSLLLLALPTAFLATMPDLANFTVLRFVQGVCMSTAFTLTMAYLAENGSAAETASALAAYVTGNVASNLVGRLMAASIVDQFGLSATFLTFAALNIAGAALAYAALNRMQPMGSGVASTSWRTVFANPAVLAGLAIGFIILFAFIGTFTYVNFVLVRPPLDLGMMQLGFVYFVFVPSIVATPFAGKAASRFGAPRVMAAALALAAIATPLLIVDSLAAVLLGLALIAVGTFFAQGTATGFVSRAAGANRGAASGLYLASYYAGGLAGSLILGMVFDGYGWTLTAIVIAAALALGAAIAVGMTRQV
jgi:predicted MFS family arabinose efflux permease